MLYLESSMTGTKRRQDFLRVTLSVSQNRHREPPTGGVAVSDLEIASAQRASQ